jgi:C_GCAxxG_C_C family probable redox protein
MDPEEIKEISRRSGEFFESGLYCAESVLLAIAEGKGIKSDVIPRIATGFCSGISRTCGLCGAVTGAIMGINLFTGGSAPDHSVDQNYALVRKLERMFEETFGSSNCMQLTGCDLSTVRGRTAFKARNLRGQCRGYTEEATRMVLTLIEAGSEE